MNLGDFDLLLNFGIVLHKTKLGGMTEYCFTVRVFSKIRMIIIIWVCKKNGINVGKAL